MPLEGLDAAAAPAERWLRAPRPSSPGTLDASRFTHGRRVAEPSRTGWRLRRPVPDAREGRCAWGSLRLATRLVVADEA